MHNVLSYCHQFVVFVTDNWYWSIEKNDKHILIQRSEGLPCVRDFRYEKAERIKRNTPVVQLRFDYGRKSMKELIEFLYRENELNNKYHWIADNCQDFAKRVFDEFAEKSFYRKVMGIFLQFL